MKRTLTIALSLILSLSLLTGCGGTSQEETAEGAASTSDDHTVSVWAWTPSLNFVAMQEAEARYQEIDPEFKLELTELSSKDIQTKITAAVVGGDMSVLPDIVLFQDNDIQKFLEFYNDAFMDISGIDIDFSQFSEMKTNFGNYDGKQYGIPFDSGTMVAAYRTDYLAAAGYTLDDFTDITWSEFIEKAQKVKEATGVSMLTDYLGTGFVTNMCKSAGDSLLTEDGTVDFVGNDTLRKSIDTYLDLVDSGALSIVVGTDEHIGGLTQGTTCCVIDGCWRLANILACPEDQSGKWGVTNIPRLDDVPSATNYSTYGGSGWYVTSNCQNPDLVFDFLAKTFGSDLSLYDTILEQTGTPAEFLPAMESEVYNQPVEWFGGQAVYADILEYSSKIPHFTPNSYQSDFNAAIGTALSNILYNDADIDSEIEVAQDTVNFSIGK
jgi:lactose/L-arabinose transport system substrate-binding protein